MNLQEQLCDWENLRLAYANASRGKRGRGATAEFESLLADNLLELEEELREQTYQPGAYSSFYIHEPKKRLISAAPFRDRVVHHALCNVSTGYFERQFIPATDMTGFIVASVCLYACVDNESNQAWFRGNPVRS